MGLAPAQPDQEVIDRLILDAAWERARQLEGELSTARAIAKQNHESLNKMAERRLKLAYGIRGVLSEYDKDPYISAGAVMEALRDLLEEEAA